MFSMLSDIDSYVSIIEVNHKYYKQDMKKTIKFMIISIRSMF